MDQASLEIPYVEARNRVTTLVRMFMAIPHTIVLYVLNLVVQVMTVVHWFIQVFTGRRNPGISGFVRKFLAYQAEVGAYLGLLYDEYPGFFDDQAKTPVRYSLDVSEGPVNRMSVALRIIFAIPAMIIGMLYGIAAGVLTLVSWIAIVVTGKHPKGMWDFLYKANRYFAQLNAYIHLLTDATPKAG